MLVALSATVAGAQTPPTIDGNLTDLIQYASDLNSTNTGTGINQTDNAGDVQVTDLSIIPCPPVVNQYYVNGFDQTLYVLARPAGSTDLFLGIRVAGVIGDTDGDGSPDLSASGGSCTIGDNIFDGAGIGPGETYQFQFDTQCAGTDPNPCVRAFNGGSGTVTITNNQIVGTGIFSGVTGSFVASGHDLEIVLHNVTLPGAFKVRTFVGSNTDGLSEDTAPVACAQPNPQIKILKSANPVTICVGHTTRFTLTIQNTGNSDLANVAVEDDLPPGLTYAGNLSGTCAVGAPQVNGSAIIFPGFSLPFGASCTISFDALAGADCLGTVTNNATVVGTAPAGGCLAVLPAITDHTSFDVVCVSNPCVNLKASGPSSACQGPLTISGSVENCSKGAETIVVTVNGAQAFNQSVAAGAVVQWTFDTSMPQCTSGETVNFAVHATAHGDCGDATPQDTVVPVLCSAPQVEISKVANPAGAVDQGTTLHYTITVTNPSSTVGLDNVVVTDNLCSAVTYQDNAVPATASAPAVGATGDITWNLGSIAPGAAKTITFDALVETLPSPACQATDLSCTNHVSVVGYCANAQATNEASYTTPINPCLQAGLCRLTGGGCLNDGSPKSHKQSTFGGNSSPEHSGGGPTGNSWEHVYRDGKTILFNWHSPDAHVISCTDVTPGPCSPKGTVTRADFVGTGSYSIGPGGRDQDGNMVAYIIDHTEGACNKNVGDYYSITVRTGLVIGAGDIVFQTAGTIDCGNLQIHQTPASLFGPVTQPVGSGAVTSVALLNRAYPNPFSGSTNFAYRVANANTRVDVGVYNVAGRLVKTLAGGVQSEGTYTLTWNGADDAGVRMAPGVYFLRSRVGSDSTVERVIYLAR